jgi:hypothetical protein
MQTAVYGGDSISGGTTNNVAVLDLPVHPINSLGQLQHANLMDQPHYPALAIGNAFPSPFLPGNDSIYHLFTVGADEGYQHGGLNGAEKAFIDLSYFANNALWDGYFFSSIAPLETDGSYDDPDVSGNIGSAIDAFLDGRSASE